MKKNRLFIISGIVILAVLCILAGLIFSIYCDNSNNTASEMVEDNSIELSLDDELVQKMFKTYHYFLSSQNKIAKAFYDIDDVVLVKNFSDDLKYELLLDEISRSNYDENDGQYLYYHSDTILGLWKNLFGSKVKFPFNGDIDKGFEKDGSYKSCIGCDSIDVETGVSQSDLLRATKNGDKIVLYEAVKFFGESVYEDYDHTKETTYTEDIDANYKFIYRYDKEIDNYYFYSIERIR